MRQTITMVPGRRSADFETIPLSVGCWIEVGRLPRCLMTTSTEFDALWSVDSSYPVGCIPGNGSVSAFRCSHGTSDCCTGHGTAIPKELERFLNWGRLHSEGEPTELQVRQHDAAQDNDRERHRECPWLDLHRSLMLISLGSTRLLRLTQTETCGTARWLLPETHDLPLTHGTVILVPSLTTTTWLPQIPFVRRADGRHILLTLSSTGRI